MLNLLGREHEVYKLHQQVQEGVRVVLPVAMCREGSHEDEEALL